MEGANDDETNEDDRNRYIALDDFPDELIIKILIHLSPYVDTKNAKLVCKRWLRLIQDIEEQKKDEFIEALKTHNVVWQVDKGKRPVLTAREGYRPTRVPVDRPSRRFSHAAARSGQYWYIFGGAYADHSFAETYNDMYVLDLSTYRWKKIRPHGKIPGARDFASLTAYYGKLFLHGGLCRPPFERAHTIPPRYFDDTFIFDTETDTWTRIELEEGYPSMRCGESASVAGNVIVTFGGAYQARQLNDAWMFNMDTLLWKFVRVRTRKPPERYGQGQFTLDEQRVIIYGGNDGNDRTLSDMWILNIEEKHWTPVRIDNMASEPRRPWSHQPVMMHGYIISLSDDKMCPYCGNFLVNSNHVVPKQPPEENAVNCTCGHKWAYRQLGNLDPMKEFKEPVYMQMYVLDCRNLADTLSCRYHEYRHLAPTPLSRQMFTSCAGINEIIIFGGVEETKPHKVDDNTIVVAPKFLNR